MLIQRSALVAELPALGRYDDTGLCECLASLGLPVDGVEEKGGHTIIDVDITANRGDACSHRGLARDLGARLGYELNSIPVDELVEGEALFPVRIESTACSLYSTAILAMGENLGTPHEVAELLSCVGGSAKQLSAVDASNEILHRYGQPTHAFDFEKLQGAVVVRWGRAGETLTTLDGVERKITAEDLVIADEKGPIGLAGVMGGEATKVTERTRMVLLESAYFDPRVVRKMAHRHGIHSDASFRFGRGTDHAMAKVARDLLVARLMEWSGATLKGAWTAGQMPATPSPVLLRGDCLARVAGEVVSLEEAARYLSLLGCEVAVNVRELHVTAPTWRHDLHIEEDFIEEVLRMRGYDRIGSVLPPLEGPPVPFSKEYIHKRSLARRLAHLGFQQTVTLGFVSPEMDVAHAESSNAAEGRTLANPLGQEYSVMRASLLGSLKAVAEANLRQGARVVKLFEIAPTYRATPRGPQEESSLAIVWAGTLGGEDYLTPARPLQVADLLGVAQDLGMGGRPDVKVLGDGLFGMEVPLSAIPQQEDRVIPTFRPFSRFPAVERDLSLLVNLDQGYRVLEESMAAAVRSQAGDAFHGLRCVDVFRHKNLPQGRQAWLMRLRFQAMDRTLTSEEVDGWVQAALEKARTLGAEIRG